MSTALLIVIGVVVVVGAIAFGLYKAVTSKRVQKVAADVQTGVKAVDQTVKGK